MVLLTRLRKSPSGSKTSKRNSPGARLSVKTGGGPKRGHSLGWYAGFVDKDGSAFVFALNIEGLKYDDIRNKRIELTKKILRRLGIL
jgi:beta-lactamase class D